MKIQHLNSCSEEWEYGFPPFGCGVAVKATPYLLGEDIWSLNQLALHHPLLALLFADLTQLGAGHQQAHLDLLPYVVVFARLGAEGQSGIVLRLGGDGVAARRHLLEDIAVGYGITDRHAIHQHWHFDSRAEGLVAIDIEVGRIFGRHKLLGLRICGGIGHGYGSTTGKQGCRQQGSTHQYLPEHSGLV